MNKKFLNCLTCAGAVPNMEGSHYCAEFDSFISDPTVENYSLLAKKEKTLGAECYRSFGRAGLASEHASYAKILEEAGEAAREAGL